ncbi:glycosyltransferase family 2 protein, partial [Bacteroides fragilis]
MCEISVVMPVYNAEMHIKDAIESVLEQSFVDFEFILIDDGSIDRTSSIIRSYNDKRVRLIQNSHNFIESLNLGIE